MEVLGALDDWIKVLTMLGAAIGFLWGVIQYFATQKALAGTREIEARKPFLERQLKLYTEATQAAATLATSRNPLEVAAASDRFWSLYWGELALVEDREVETAMVNLGAEIKKGRTGEELEQRSLKLAHACRNSLAKSWGVAHWKNPHGS